MVIPLVQIIVVLIILGLIWWVVSTMLPIPQPFKNVILVLIVLVLVLYLLSLIGAFGTIRLGWAASAPVPWLA